MNYVSTFSGIGGFDLGFDRAGMECQAQVEIDLFALEVLGKHWPNVPKFRDIRKFNYEQHGLEKGTIDLVCGGFPCQDLSIAGRREGLAGERSGLYFEFHRIITELQPKWVVIENVPGLLSSNGGKDFAIVIGGLTGIVPAVPKGGWGGAGFFRGPVYKVAYRVLDAQYFGVAQRRRRVFIVASLTDGRAAKVLFECEGMSRNTPPRREEGQGFARTAGTLAASGGRLDRPAGNANELDFCVPVASPVRTSAGRWMADGADNFIAFDGRNMDTHEQSPTLQAKKSGYSLNYTPMVLASGNDIASTLNASYSTKWGLGDQEAFSGDFHVISNPQETPVVWDKLQETSVAHKTKPQSKLSYILNKAGQMMVGVRRLTPAECARLQGFPDDHNDFLSDAQRYKQFGNAVAVPVAEWLGRRIVQVNNEYH